MDSSDSVHTPNSLVASIPFQCCSRPRRQLASQRFRRPTSFSRPPPDRFAASSLAFALLKTQPTDHLTAIPPAPALLKAPPPTRLAAFPLVHVTFKTPTYNRLAAFPPAHGILEPLPSTRLAAPSSITYLPSTPSPNHLEAPKKRPRSLALLLVWLPGHPSSLHRLLRASRSRPLLVTLVPRRT